MKVLTAQALTSSSSTPNLRGGQGHLQMLCPGKYVLSCVLAYFFGGGLGAKTGELVRQPEVQAQQQDEFYVL